MRNVEIKARVQDVKRICQIAEELSGGTYELIKQDDTFYRVPNGRLKLRIYEDLSATLVRYERKDEGGPKLSDYDLLEFSSTEKEKYMKLDKMLKICLGERGRVVKERKLYMVGQTRIHIDSVLGLGDFMELEVVFRPDQTLEDGQKIAEDLKTKLEVRNENLIDCAYMDLLENP